MANIAVERDAPPASRLRAPHLERYLRRGMKMPELKMIIVVVLALSLVSCATAPGKLTDADFVSRQVSIDLPLSKAAAQLREGLRYCGPSSGGVVFVTHHGVPECMPAQEDGSILCDLYLVGAYGGRSDFVLGRIELKPTRTSVGTAAVLRVQAYAANKDKILESWELFLRGRAKDVCP